MKKKQIRTIAIAAIVAVALLGVFLRLRIEPADKPVEDAQLSAQENIPQAEPEVPEKTQDETPQAPEEPIEEKTEPNPEEQQPVEELPVISQEPPEEIGKPEEQPEEPAAPEKEKPTEPAAPAPEETPAKRVCTIEIRCDTVVDTSVVENEAVIPYIPASGVILAATEVEFTEGETVFDILQRVTRDKGIHMEFREEALYSGYYIEGINYLYEFDAGSLSGWMYKVDGQFPNYGCGNYFVEDNDAIVWMYTCDLGRDVGDNSTW